MKPFAVKGKPFECGREQEVLEALASDATLDSWSDELRAHARACAICSDVVAVALPLLRDHHETLAGAHPPSSGVVWWRAQMRARQEAAKVATRPITVLQGVAAASAIALLVMLLSATGPTLSGWFGGLSLFSGWGELLALPPIDLASLKPSGNTGLLIAGAAVCLLLGPLAVYFALSDE